jgi:TATA-box binding protein (TBP) (component of TFIID and TFIIIB)
MEQMDSEVLLLYNDLHLFTGAFRQVVPLTIVEKNIHMINLSFKISKLLNLTDIETKLPHSWSSVYEPDIYCALILHTALFKAILFKTGSVILTGCKSMDQLQEAFSVLSKFLSGIL